MQHVLTLYLCVLTGHLFHKFGITESDWYRIKQSIDSKCRTAWRRKQRGQSLAVKSFSKRTPRGTSAGNVCLCACVCVWVCVCVCVWVYWICYTTYMLCDRQLERETQCWIHLDNDVWFSNQRPLSFLPSTFPVGYLLCITLYPNMSKNITENRSAEERKYGKWQHPKYQSVTSPAGLSHPLLNYKYI